MAYLRFANLNEAVPEPEACKLMNDQDKDEAIHGSVEVTTRPSTLWQTVSFYLPYFNRVF